MDNVMIIYQVVSWLIVIVALTKITTEKYKVKGEVVPTLPILVNSLLSVFLGWLILPMMIGYTIGLVVSKLDK